MFNDNYFFPGHEAGTATAAHIPVTRVQAIKGGIAKEIKLNHLFEDPVFLVKYIMKKFEYVTLGLYITSTGVFKYREFMLLIFMKAYYYMCSFYVYIQFLMQFHCENEYGIDLIEISLFCRVIKFKF